MADDEEAVLTPDVASSGTGKRWRSYVFMGILVIAWLGTLAGFIAGTVLPLYVCFLVSLLQSFVCAYETTSPLNNFKLYSVLYLRDFDLYKM